MTLLSGHDARSMNLMLDEHLAYITDAVRLERFRAALDKVVRRGDRVADLGCGTGILGLLCLRAGAGRVYFVDDSPMIEVARRAVERAGLSEQAVFISGRSLRVELPERVDLALCDHVGYFGLDYGIVPLMQDAGRRFLKPGASSMPVRIKLQVAAVESERCHELADAWHAGPVEFRWLGEYSVNRKYPMNLRREELFGGPADLGTIDLRERNAEFFSWKAAMRAERDAVVHGIGGWFDCELAEGVWMTNSPVSGSSIRRDQAFFPIGEPVRLKAGDRLNVAVMARPADDLIAWTVEFPATGQRFSHSTWQGSLLASEDLMRANPYRMPKPTRDGLARMTVLGYCDGTRSAREIEQAVLQEHPQLFPSAAEISRFIALVLGRDTR